MEVKSVSKHATVGGCNQRVGVKIGNIFTDLCMCPHMGHSPVRVLEMLV